MLYTEFTYEDYELLLEEEMSQKQKRGEFVKNTYQKKWDEKHGVPGYKDIDKFIEKLLEVDPSLKGIYVPWMAKLIMQNPNENKPEDLDRVGDDLVTFERNKSKIENKDINAYKSFQILYDVVAPFLVKREKTPEELAAEENDAEKARIKSQIIDVYTGPEGWIKVPTTVESSKFLGQNTRWCTAAEKSNMFDHYNKSDRMFIVYDKASKKRTQLHLDSSQFADESDRNLGFDAVPKWAWKPIVEWYKKTNPSLKFKQIAVLSKYVDDDLITGSAHEGIFDLMKKYGVK